MQAIYLDDQMSGWSITSNAFVNCQIGSFVGGGRRNVVTGNYYEKCDTAQHLDNRGMNWEKSSAMCTAPACEPLVTGCQCNPSAAEWMVTVAPAAATWATRFPYLNATGTDKPGLPAYNIVSMNSYCNCGTFIDASATDIEKWGSTAEHNTEVKTCQTQPHTFSADSDIAVGPAAVLEDVPSMVAAREYRRQRAVLG